MANLVSKFVEHATEKMGAAQVVVNTLIVWLLVG